MNTKDLKALCSVFNISLNDRYIYIPERNINLTVKKENGITVINGITENILQQLIKQNNAYCIEYNDGCLLDNVLYGCKNGYMACYETYLNCYSSCYQIKFSRDNSVLNEYYERF